MQIYELKKEIIYRTNCLNELVLNMSLSTAIRGLHHLESKFITDFWFDSVHNNTFKGNFYNTGETVQVRRANRCCAKRPELEEK